MQSLEARVELPHSQDIGSSLYGHIGRALTLAL